MTISKQLLLRSLLIGTLVGLTAGCGNAPTYPKAQLTSSVEQVLTSDDLHASVRFIDHTLGVQLQAPGTISHNDTQIGIGPAFDEIARKVITDIHRVVLSSDADVRFYVMLLSDPQVPGVYLTVVRYMDDVKRANANMIDTPEMFARTIFELNYVGANNVTIDQYLPRDIRLEEFLSWQLARRIQHKLSDELEGSGTATVGRCGGKFQDGEFAFTLDVAPATAEHPLDELTMQKIFQSSTNEIAKVLSGYRFDAFKAIRLIYPPTGRNLVLPKARLDLFR